MREDREPLNSEMSENLGVAKFVLMEKKKKKVALNSGVGEGEGHWPPR